MLALLAWVPGGAAAETSFVPLPAFDTDPNSGETYGILPVVLFRNDKDEVRSILAPSVTYNDFRGVTGTFRFFDFPSQAERIDLVVGYSQNIGWNFDLHYRNLGLLAGRFHADVELLRDPDATVRFFGLGPNSKKATETNMTLQETGFLAAVGVNITTTARLSLGETVAQYDVLRGAVPGLPFTRDVFPDVPGIDGAFVHAQRIALTYDGRNSLTTPTRGLSVTLYAEASTKLLGSGSDYIKSGAETVYLHPFFTDAWMVLVTRGRVEAISKNADTPFEVFPTLGGARTLRGFSNNRFYGDASVLLNLEARVRLFTLRLFGVTTEFQAAPFVDMGRVFSQVKQLQDRVEVTPGVGFRGLVAPSIVGRVDMGVSQEGVAVFVGLDYPF